MLFAALPSADARVRWRWRWRQLSRLSSSFVVPTLLLLVAVIVVVFVVARDFQDLKDDDDVRVDAAFTIQRAYRARQRIRMQPKRQGEVLGTAAACCWALAHLHREQLLPWRDHGMLQYVRVYLRRR